ncbi:hypothetical protein LCGC14_2572530 [marine sediment metagenome]|uniref:Uncharacterized protein n=1 Tax=marine sediment metagenome TaxID=412755 RepID=A0A0F9CT16_9ZZZZ
MSVSGQELSSTMKVCEVLWWDAWIDTKDISIKAAAKLKPILRTTVGFLVAENAHGVVLSTDYFNKKKVREVYLEQASADPSVQILDCADKQGEMLPPDEIFIKIRNILFE